jgi:hypothetical protein
MAKARKVQLKIVERENDFELVNAEVSKSRAEILIKQYQKMFAGIDCEMRAA